MSIVMTDNQHYSDIASVIRNINNSTNTYTPDQMANAITELTNYAKIIVTVTPDTNVLATCDGINKIGFMRDGKYVFYNCTGGTWNITTYVNGVQKTASVKVHDSNPQYYYLVTIT